MAEQVPNIYYDLQVVYAGDDQCDCGLYAPPEETTWQRRYRLSQFDPDQRYWLNTRLRQQPLTVDGKSHTAIYSPSHSRIAVLNEAAQHLLAQFADGGSPGSVIAQSTEPRAAMSLVDTCHRLGYLGDSVNPVTTPPAIQENLLTAWLHVTNTCSLNCKYCYADTTGTQQMDESTGYRALEAIFDTLAKYQFGGVKIKYSGGEPTLSWELVMALQTRALQLAAEHQVHLSATVLSNGVNLTPLMFNQLRDAQLNLSISLDGLASAHDQQRPLHGGGPSSHRVLKNIEMALAHGTKPHILITLTRQSIHGLPELVRWLNMRDLSFVLNFYRAHAPQFLRFELDAHDTISTIKQVLHEAAHPTPPRRSWLSILDRANLSFSHPAPCAMGDSYVVIDHQGRLARCQMTMHDSIGTIADADLLQAIRLKSTRHTQARC